VIHQTSHKMMSEFADWILKIEDSLLDANENLEAKIQIPEELCILSKYSSKRTKCKFL